MIEDHLVAEAPVLFRDGVQCGVNVPPGWFGLVLALCLQLERIAQQQEGLEQEPVRVDQIKEKFGELRFYLDRYDTECEQLINVFMRASRQICTLCGQPATRNLKQNWIQTYCEKHWTEWHER